MGQRFRRTPAAFDELRRVAGDALEVAEFAERGTYLERLREAHVVLSTARHEFFGLGALEALRSGCLPVLPDDLAYPELFPEGLAAPERFLYPRAEGAARPVERALEAVCSGAWMDDRRRLVDHTDAFLWGALAPRYDRVFERALTPSR